MKKPKETIRPWVPGVNQAFQAKAAAEGDTRVKVEEAIVRLARHNKLPWPAEGRIKCPVCGTHTMSYNVNESGGIWYACSNFDCPSRTVRNRGGK